MGEVNHVVFPLLGDKTARLAHRDMGRGVNHLEALAPEKHRVALAMGKLSENFGVPGILVTGLAHRLFVQRSGHNAADPAGQRPIDGGAHREEGAASSHRRNLSDDDLLKGNRVRVHDIDAAGLYLAPALSIKCSGVSIPSLPRYQSSIGAEPKTMQRPISSGRRRSALSTTSGPTPQGSPAVIPK